MKLNLLAKAIALYIAISIVSFLGVTFVSFRIEYNTVYQDYSDSLYRQAIDVADNYAKEYFSDERMKVIEGELSTVSKLSNDRIIFLSTSGDIIVDTDKTLSPKANGEYTSVPNFDYSLLGSSHSIESTLYGTLSETNLCFFAPVANSFTTKGYVVVMIPTRIITDQVYKTFNTNYFTWLMVLILGLSLIVMYTLYVHKPIAGLSKAIDEYGKGNLYYEVKINQNDEIGRLGASLNYMATELNQMDKFQQTFLSNISHDFRSPLTSIKGYLEAIKDGTIPPSEMNRYLDIVLYETDRLTKLTNNILTLNELDPISVRLDMSDFDINSVIRHTIETLEGNCRKRKIHFDLTLASPKQMVRADREKIQQVVYNLIDNAIKFSKDNSTIYVSLRERGDKVYISVKDTGIGIDKSRIDKIWERFYKSDVSRGRDKKGSGLGLAIVKEIIQAQGETIDVISTLGVGTEFVFSLTKSRGK